MMATHFLIFQTYNIFSFRSSSCRYSGCDSKDITYGGEGGKNLLFVLVDKKLC